MSLDSLAAVVGFLFFIAPGLVFDRRFSAGRPERSRTTLQELGETVVSSVVIASCVGAAMWAIASLAEMTTIDLPRLMSDGSYLSAESDAVGVWAVIWVASALIVAEIAGRCLAKSDPASAKFSKDPAVWTHLAVETRSARKVMTTVRTADGGVLFGRLVSIDIGNEEANPFLVLEAKALQRPGDSPEAAPEEFQRTFVAMGQVSELWVSVAESGADQA